MIQKTLGLVILICATGCMQGQKNVEACEDWLDSVSCGGEDLSAYIDCSTFDEYDCDVADYFDCLSDETTCDEYGYADVTGWSNCYYLAACD